MINHLLDFVFPLNCFICSSRSSGVCQSCLNCLEAAHLKCMGCGRKNPFGIYCNSCRRNYHPEYILARFAFKGALRELIHQFKYEDCTVLREPLGHEIGKVISRIPRYRDYSITYIPLSKKRLLGRGYNQAMLLAEAVAQELKMPLTDLILRADTPQSQVQADDPKERKRNIKGVFNVKDNVEIPQKIVLIDDVVTTGATLEEATRVLKEAGAKDVYVVALAMA